MTVGAKAEFQHLGESAVLAALDTTDPQNAIAIEVGRLVAAYTTLLRGRPFPSADAPLPAHFPIETVALRLANRLAGRPVLKDGASAEG